jgi:DNA helicase HerA-like ATPase
MQTPVPPKEPQHHVVPRSIGRIASVTGSRAILLLDVTHENDPRSRAERPEMGTLLAIDTGQATVLATVAALSVPVPAHGTEQEIRIAELGLVGELTKGADGKPLSFNRGTTTYPTLGDRVRFATKYELQLTYTGTTADSVRIGSIRQDSSIPAMIKVDELLGKHFAILGTTGTGKSCSTALILRAILDKSPNAHIVLLDPHNEYATAFTDRAEVISPRTLQLPLWLLNFEEAVEVLVGDTERKGEIEILQDLIPLAKARYSAGRAQDPGKLRKPGLDGTRFTVDTPVPYRISDLLKLLTDRMGKLENRSSWMKYHRLVSRIESLGHDSRYTFMFNNVFIEDLMVDVIADLFRLPIAGQPITVMQLAGLPAEVVDSVVSVVCRMAFEFGVWSDGAAPILVASEEAHRYAPADRKLGFGPTRKALSRIAKEGRKYGVFLAAITQRPADLDATILSQCSTIFAMRMANDRDQEIVSSATPDAGVSLLEFLPSLGIAEAIAFGEGVALPTRLHFSRVPPEQIPRSQTGPRVSMQGRDDIDADFIASVVDRWREATTTTSRPRMALSALDRDGPEPPDDAWGAPFAPPPPERQTLP